MYDLAAEAVRKIIFASTYNYGKGRTMRSWIDFL
jgi:hypothetical protein